MGGDKPLRHWRGRPLAAYPVDLLARLCAEVLLVGAPEGLEVLDVRRVPDREPGLGPLGGLVTGLERARHDWCLVLACDLPMMRTPVLELLVGHREGVEAVVPEVDGRLQPLAACYARSCGPALDACLREGRLSLQRALAELRVKIVPEDEVRAVDPDLVSFRNVNTPADLAALDHDRP